jgi:hypothetical protein
LAKIIRTVLYKLMFKRHDIQHNDNQQNNIQRDDTQHIDIQHNNK